MYGIGTERKKLPAYMSVEASLIMTAVIVLWVVMIYLAFFLYDRCLFAQDSYILCFRESYVKQERDLAAELKALESRQLGSKYFFLSSRSSSSGKEGRKIVYQGNAAITPAVFRGSGMMPAGTWRMSFRAEARRTDPPGGIRKFRRLRYLAGKVIGKQEKGERNGGGR